MKWCRRILITLFSCIFSLNVLLASVVPNASAADSYVSSAEVYLEIPGTPYCRYPATSVTVPVTIGNLSATAKTLTVESIQVYSGDGRLVAEQSPRTPVASIAGIASTPESVRSILGIVVPSDGTVTTARQFLSQAGNVPDRMTDEQKAARETMVLSAYYSSQETYVDAEASPEQEEVLKSLFYTSVQIDLTQLKPGIRSVDFVSLKVRVVLSDPGQSAPGGSLVAEADAPVYLLASLPAASGWQAGDGHVHSTYSDGWDTVLTVGSMADQHGLRWIVATDHAGVDLADLPLFWRLELDEWDAYKADCATASAVWPSVLVCPGEELAAVEGTTDGQDPKSGHYLTYRNTQYAASYVDAYTDDLVQRSNSAGGFGVIAHPFSGDFHWGGDWSVVGQDSGQQGSAGLEVLSCESGYSLDAVVKWDELLTAKVVATESFSSGYPFAVGTANSDYHREAVKDYYGSNMTYLFTGKTDTPTTADVYDAIKEGKAVASSDGSFATATLTRGTAPDVPNGTSHIDPGGYIEVGQGGDIRIDVSFWSLDNQSTSAKIKIVSNEVINGVARGVVINGLDQDGNGEHDGVTVTGSSGAYLFTCTADTDSYYRVQVEFQDRAAYCFVNPMFVKVGLPAPDISISASPTSRSVVAGGSAAYTVAITALNGFNLPITLSATGLPTGATASFNPSTLTPTGSSAMTISTSASTPSGSSTLTITAQGGGKTDTAQVTLTVTSSPDFSISVSPDYQTVAPGGSTAYTVTLTAQNGFNQPVTLSATGLPTGATPSFAPPSLVPSPSGSTTILTVATSQDQNVTLTLYMCENTASGPALPGVSVGVTDGGGSPLGGTTNSSGYLTITGTPGTWNFTAMKSGYDTRSWSLPVTATATRYEYIVKSATPVGTINVFATLDGTGWAGGLNYTLTGPSSSNGSAVPVVLSNKPTGSYSIAFNSGGPPNSVLQSITPSSTQAVSAGGITTFTLNFVTQAPQNVTLTLYMCENTASGPALPGVSVGVTDGGGSPLGGTTNSSGYLTITGTPGTWNFTAMKSGYDTRSWSLPVTATATRYEYIVKSATPVGTINVFATLDGTGWAGGLNYTLTGPSSSNGSAVPVVLSNKPTGSYSIAFNSGGPPNSVLQSITPSSTQAVSAGGITTFTLNFVTQAPQNVTLTLYMCENTASGPALPGVSVGVTDGGGHTSGQTTNSSGYVTVAGTPGTWYFAAVKSGYNTNSWSQPITVTCTKYGYIVKSPSAAGVSDPILASTPSGSSTLTITATGGGKTHAVQVTLNVTSSPTPPSTPQSFTATPGNAQVTLGWSAPASNGGSAVTSYYIYRGTVSGGVSYLTAVGGATYSYLDTGRTNGTTYYYQVSAVNSVGEGTKCAERSATPVAASGDQYEPDNDYQSAKVISTDGTRQTHTIDPVADNDWMKFAATAGVQYTIQTGSLLGGCDTYVYLYGPDGTTMIAQNDDSGGVLSSQIVWTCSSSATYYVRVHDYSSSRGGPGVGYNILITSATGGLPDLTVDTLSFDPAQPTPGGAVRFNYVVRNQGSGPVTAASQLYVYFDGAFAGSGTLMNPFASGGSQAWYTDMVWPSDTASHTFTAVVDATGVITESNESNNSASISASAAASQAAVPVVVESWNGIWRYWIQGVPAPHVYGTTSMTPLLGDWDGDSVDEPVVVESWSGTLRFWCEGAPSPIVYGAPGMTVLMGDMDGDGTDEPVVVESWNGIWRFWCQGLPSPIVYGTTAMTPLLADTDGDGTDEPTVVESWNGIWRFWCEGAPSPIVYGTTAMTPLLGDWDGCGTDEPIVVESWSGTLRFWCEGNPSPIVYGAPGMRVLMGRP